MSYSRLSGLFLMLLVLAACAAMKNTPAQERVESDFAACKSETRDDVTLERVTPEGEFLVPAGNESDRGTAVPGLHGIQGLPLCEVRRRDAAIRGVGACPAFQSRGERADQIAQGRRLAEDRRSVQPLQVTTHRLGV